MDIFTSSSFYRNLNEPARKSLKETIDLEKAAIDLWNHKFRQKLFILLLLSLLSVVPVIIAIVTFGPKKIGLRKTARTAYHVLEIGVIKKDVGKAVSIIIEYFDLGGSSANQPKEGATVDTDPALNEAQKRHLEIEKNINEKLSVLNNGQSVKKTADDIPFYMYTPRRGNSVERLAKKHGMSLDELIRLNEFLIGNPNHIEYGPEAPRIKVRAWRLYRIKKGDTFKSIVRTIRSEGLRMSVSYLDRVNPDLNHRARVGRIMIIPCPLGQ